MEKKLESEIQGNLSPKLGGVAPDFDSRFGGIEATGQAGQRYLTTHKVKVSYSIQAAPDEAM